MTTDLISEMEKYLRDLQRTRFARPPREALAAAAGGEIYGPEMHLAFNVAPYIIAGGYARAADRAGARVLEIGSGTGYDTAYLKHHFLRRAEVTGIDRVPALAGYAAAHHPRPGLRFLSADGLFLPFREASFEMVFSVFSIVHTMEKTGARNCLCEISRVLKPGGRLIFSTPNRALSQDLYHRNPRDLPRLFFCHLLRTEYYLKDLEKLFRSPGPNGEKPFASVSIEGISNPTLRPVWKEVLDDLGSSRFGATGRESLLAAVARGVLPQGFKARYFFRKIRQSCRRRKITLRDIARGGRHYPDLSDETADHFIVIARKAGGG